MLLFLSIVLTNETEALVASSVKVKARDVVASWKCLVAFAVLPPLYSFYVVLSLALAINWDATMKWRILIPILVSLGVPASTLIALKAGEAALDILKSVLRIWREEEHSHWSRSLPHLIFPMIPGVSRYLFKLKAMRNAVAKEVQDVVDDFGPQIFDGFERAKFSPIVTVDQVPYRMAGVRKRTNFAVSNSSSIRLPVLRLS